MPLDIPPWHEFECFYPASGFTLQAVEQWERIFQLAQPDHCCDIGQRLSVKAQNRSCDNAQSSLSANEHMLEIEPGVILAQLRHQIHHLTIGQNHLQTKAKITGIAIAQHIRAACVCR